MKTKSDILSIVDKEGIIDLIYHNREFKDACRKITNNSDLHKDLFQEVICFIYRQPESYLLEIYRKGHIRYYFVGIISRMWNWEKGDFYQLYRKSHETSYIELADATDDERNEDVQWREFMGKAADDVKAQIEKWKGSQNRAEWYKGNLFHQYLELGSQRKLAKKTRIPLNTINRVINSTVKELRGK